MMINKKNSLNSILLIGLTVIIIWSSLSLYLVNATPEGASISGASVDTGPNKTPNSRTDLGGRITTLILSLEQQNYAWKGYIGNVTGSYVLQNSNNRSIYEWPLGTAITGEVYMSRSNAVNFSSGAISCANNTVMVTEQTVFGMGATDTDNVNNTFNNTNHSLLRVGSNVLAQSTCRSIALWVNDTVQAATNTSIFQEVTLFDRTNLIYASIINNDNTGFDNTTTFDFQIIVPENRSAAAGTAYYFYVELGS